MPSVTLFGVRAGVFGVRAVESADAGVRGAETSDGGSEPGEAVTSAGDVWLAPASELGAGLAVSLAAAAAAAAAVGDESHGASWIARNDGGAGECDTRDEPSAGDTALEFEPPVSRW